MAYKFTKKTRLAYEWLVELHNVWPDVHQMPDIEDRKWQTEIEYKARTSSANYLQSQIDYTKKLREEQEKRERVKEAKQKYWEEHPGEKEDAMFKRSDTLNDWRTLRVDTQLIINKHLADKVGPFWKVVYLSENSARLVINRTTSSDPSLLVEDDTSITRFGCDLDFYFKSFLRDDPDFVSQLNLGTTGSFPIFYGDTDRAQFYIELGKLLSNEDLLSHLECIMLDYCEKAEKYRSDIKHYEKFLDNPADV